MASILKVDTLQKPDGSTPTAADLGIDVAGSVVQVYEHSFTETTMITTTALSDVTGSSFSFTPKYPDSKVIVTMIISCNWQDASDAAGGSYQLYIDGVKVTSYPAHLVYGDFNSTNIDQYVPVVTQHSFVAGSVTAKTLSLKAQMYQSDDTRMAINNAGGYVSVITVYEIAQ